MEFLFNIVIEKPFLELKDQINLLKSRGLVFDDDEEAQKYLLMNNYYNVINCYSKFFCINEDKYLENTNFNEIIAVHIFDKEIKNILLKNIITVENYFRSILAYCYSKKLGNEKFAYINEDNYERSHYYEYIKLIKDLSGLIDNKFIESNNAINHYITKHGELPIWVLCEFMTFGQTLGLFNCVTLNIKADVTHKINDLINENLSTNTIRLSTEQLHKILDNIKNIRNVAAHNNKLFDYKCRYNYNYLKELHEQYNISNCFCMNDVYNTFIILRIFIGEKQYANMHNAIRKRVGNLSRALKTISVDDVISSFGFPNNWYKNSRKIVK